MQLRGIPRFQPKVLDYGICHVFMDSVWAICIIWLKNSHFLKFLLEKAPKKHVNSLNVLYFRAKEKQRKKQKRREALERGDTMAPTRKKLRSNTMAKSSCKTSVVIDCSLDSYMGEKVRQNNLKYIDILFFLITGTYTFQFLFNLKIKVKRYCIKS